MVPGVGRAVAAVAGFGVHPSAPVAQWISPSVVVDAPALVRALGSVVVVGLIGAALLVRSERFVDRAVKDTMERPTVAVGYGAVAFVFVVFAWLYANNLLAQVGLVGTPFGSLALVVLVGGTLALGGLGYLVVGTLLTDLYGRRRPWPGLLLGAAISGVGWLALPLTTAVIAWLLIAAFGVGGPTRTWFHGKRAAPTEVDR